MEDYFLADLNRDILFITGSTFQGAWKSETHSMDGFGIYKYPDGSVYRGYFRGGKFQGAGRLKAASPYNFILYGDFEDGRLVKLDCMVFHDGLRIHGDVKGNAIDFSEWQYCSKSDRRFVKEHERGLKGFGSIPETSVEPKKPLKPGFYDNVDGIFNEKRGFLCDRMPPFKPMQFIGCLKEIHWIKRRCRAGRCVREVLEPSEAVCRSILECNIQSQRWANGNFGDLCSDEQRETYKYFANLYEKDLKKAQRIVNGEQPDDFEVCVDEDSESSASFSVATPRNDALLERIQEGMKSRCAESLSMDFAASDMIKLMYD